MIAIALAIVLSGCADDSSQRQFANDPQATEDLVGQPPEPAATRVVSATALPATPISSAQLLEIGGEVKTLYVRQGNDVLAVSLTDGSVRAVLREKKAMVAAVAPSPTGDAVAVLVRDEKKGEVALHLVPRSGEQAISVTIGTAAGDKTRSDGNDTVAWSPAGDRLLVSRREGGIYEARTDGSVRTILSPDLAPTPRAIAWSPTGSSIAFADAGADGSATGLYVASIEALPLDPVTVIRPIAGRSRQIQEIAWVGGSVGIVYSERAADGDLSIGGDLFAVPASGGAPRLLATAGGVAQVGAVGGFAVSPNLQAVAYSVLVPGDENPIAGKLVVRQIDGTTSVPLPIQGNGQVAAFAWSTSGIVWAESINGGLIVNRVGVDGQAVAMVTIGIAASPVASPVPVGSPVVVASPVG